MQNVSSHSHFAEVDADADPVDRGAVGAEAGAGTFTGILTGIGTVDFCGAGQGSGAAARLTGPSKLKPPPSESSGGHTLRPGDLPPHLS